MGRIIVSLPAFAWKGGKVYGPFKKEDVVILPTDILDALTNKRVIKKIFPKE